jgi:hypothetical protein
VGEVEGGEEGVVAVLITSRASFQVQRRTPRRIEVANSFCRYLEMARPVQAVVDLQPDPESRSGEI